VQFHPEFDDVTMRLYLEVRRDSMDAEHGVGASDARIANVTVTNQAASVLRRFAQVAIDEAQRRG
jgi:GMP synthase-like glutamine amidotransferase